jgi:hypothetical protein
MRQPNASRGKATAWVFIGAVLVLMLVSCQDGATNSSSPLLFFPLQREVNPDTMDALLVGRLVLVNGCLRIKDGEDSGYLPIWPQGFSLSVEGDTVQILDGSGRPVARVGDEIELRGGQVPVERVAEYTTQPPSACPGPYWVVGAEFHK